MWTMFRRNKAMKPTDQQRLKQLELDLEDVKIEQLRQKGHLYKLSGTVYSRLSKKGLPREGVEDDRRLTSDEILARAGFVPGRPMPTQPPPGSLIDD